MSTHKGQPPRLVQHATMKMQPIGHPPPNKCTKQPKPATEVQLKWRCLAKMGDIATESTKTQVPPKINFNHCHSSIKGSQNSNGHGPYHHHGTRLILTSYSLVCEDIRLIMQSWRANFAIIAKVEKWMGQRSCMHVVLTTKMKQICRATCKYREAISKKNGNGRFVVFLGLEGLLAHHK